MDGSYVNIHPLCISGIGGKLYVKEDGDRDTDCSLLDLDPATGKFHVIMSLVVRKPVFGVSDQVRHKPGCTDT